MRLVRVQADDFDAGKHIAALSQGRVDVGGIGSFVGVVRSDAARPITAMTLEHYPAMTVAAMEEVVSEAERRFGLLGCIVIHRFGRLIPGDRIVLVAAAAGHRRAALQGTEFLIDWLKTKAPFWKQEEFADGHRAWVKARADDDDAARRW